MSARAFILEPTMHDSHSAKSFGEVIMIFAHANDHPPYFSAGFQKAVLLRLLEEKFDPAKDFVVVTGAQVAITALVAIIASRWGQIQSLCFNAKRREYELVPMGSNQDF